MVILGIDPGLERTGYGIIKKTGDQCDLIDFGCIFTSKRDSHQKRLTNIYQKLQKLIIEHKPQIMVVERIFYNTNKKTAISIAQSQGVLLLLAGQYELEIIFLAPQTIKLSLTGYGQAEKIQMQKMIQIILNLDTIPKPDDTADAIAAALAYSNTNQSMLI